jgi:hypothetical protein
LSGVQTSLIPWLLALEGSNKLLKLLLLLVKLGSINVNGFSNPQRGGGGEEQLLWRSQTATEQELAIYCWLRASMSCKEEYMHHSATGYRCFDKYLQVKWLVKAQKLESYISTYSE